MQDDFSMYDAADVVDIVLFKYNYNDNKLWTGIRNKIDFLSPDKNSIIVTKDQLLDFIEREFPNEINLFNSVGFEVMHKEVNSIFFITKLLTQMKHLRWIKLTLNKNRTYTRLTKDEGGHDTIKFGFKILHLTLKTFEIFDEDEVVIFNKVLH
jgi:hypothetical protein